MTGLADGSAITAVAASKLTGALPAIDGSALTGLSGGGLGDVAIRYGYQRFQVDVMFISVISIIVLVQIVQFTGNTVVNNINAKRK